MEKNENCDDIIVPEDADGETVEGRNGGKEKRSEENKSSTWGGKKNTQMRSVKGAWTRRGNLMRIAEVNEKPPEAARTDEDNGEKTGRRMKRFSGRITRRGLRHGNKGIRCSMSNDNVRSRHEGGCSVGKEGM